MWCCEPRAVEQPRSSSPSRHRLCRRQAPLNGASRATRTQMICPQRHHATNHRLITWRVTELYGAKRRRRQQRCREILFSGGCDKTGSSETASAPTPSMSALGALLPRFLGNASANHMPAMSSRKQSPPNTMARHRTFHAQWRRRWRRCRRDCVFWV